MLARHERSFGRYQQVLDYERYLEVSLRKPGVLEGSRTLRQYFEHGHWAEGFNRLWRNLDRREG